MLVIKEVIELDKVGMVKKGLDFDFIDELFYHFLLMFTRDIQDRCFLDNLECTDEASLLVTTLLQKYIARKT